MDKDTAAGSADKDIDIILTETLSNQHYFQEKTTWKTTKQHYRNRIPTTPQRIPASAARAEVPARDKETVQQVAGERAVDVGVARVAVKVMAVAGALKPGFSSGLKAACDCFIKYFFEEVLLCRDLIKEDQ